MTMVFTTKKKKGFTAIAAGLLLIISAIYFTRIDRAFDAEVPASFPTHALSIEKIWRLEIAATPEGRALGLGKRESLPEGKGMLFLFPSASQYGFWMKDMRFPIDIIFLRSGRVISVERSVSPSDRRIITPPEAADQVLEVNAGEGKHLSVGDQLWYWRSFQWGK